MIRKTGNRNVHGLSRRDVLKLGAGAAFVAAMPRIAIPAQGTATMIKRPIPSSGELLPVVGLGTSDTFDVGDSAEERLPLRGVLQLMIENGASVIDSSPMYGRSEGVIGDLTSDMGIQDEIFYATKVWTRGREDGIEQMEQSFARFKVDVIDLVQVHNLIDTDTHLDTLDDWKKAGRIRYTGITHYQESAYDGLMRVMRGRKIDFVQFNYSPLNTDAEKELLPLAADRGVATLINRPFLDGQAFSLTRGKELPPWAEEFDCESWAQFFLKYIVGHPAVTCVIPGTSDPRHARDNFAAGHGRLPDEKMRKRMRDYLREL
jgi:diketogulonate reductase-like aldo/keto reductase